MRRAWLVPFLVLSVVACSGSDDLGPAGGSDGGTDLTDARPGDGGFIPWDSGLSGEEDAGFGFPSTLKQGIEIIEGARTAIEIRGATTSTMPPIIFFNTGPIVGHEYWLNETEFLLGPGGANDPDRTLVYFDMLATGRSGFGAVGTSSVTIENHVDHTTDVMDYVNDFLGRTGSFDIVAHGYGSLVAMMIGIDAPERVSRMVFVAPFPSDVDEYAFYFAEWNDRLSGSDRERLNFTIRDWEYCFSDLNRCSLDTWNIIGPVHFCDENRDLYDAMRFESADFRPYFRFTLLDLRDRQFDFESTLAQLPQPVTIISGPCDPIPATAPATYARAIPDSTHFILPQTGHFPMVEDVARFRSIVRGALTYP